MNAVDFFYIRLEIAQTFKPVLDEPKRMFPCCCKTLRADHVFHSGKFTGSWGKLVFGVLSEIWERLVEERMRLLQL